jgi:hypothetical protein
MGQSSPRSTRRIKESPGKATLDFWNALRPEGNTIIGIVPPSFISYTVGAGGICPTLTPNPTYVIWLSNWPA